MSGKHYGSYDAGIEDIVTDPISHSGKPITYSQQCPMHPATGNRAVYLGTLGMLAMFRCRDCGAIFSEEID
jgi:hypothetical protein